MATLIFLDGGHEYFLDGVELPNMSTILRFISRELYGDIQQWTLDNAADRGKRGHKALEVLDKYREVECDADIEPQVRGYAAWLKEKKPTWELIEKPMHHPTLMYAGTPDRIGIIGGKRVMIDYKFQEQIKPKLVRAQLCGYADMYESATGNTIDALMCLQFKRDGKVRQHDIERDPGDWWACWTLHTSLQKKPRKKKESADGNTDK